MYSGVAGEVVWLYTHNLNLSLLVFGVAALMLATWWFLFQWQSKVTWFCRLQWIFFKAGALPENWKFVEDASPFNVDLRMQAVVDEAAVVVQENIKSLAANRQTLDRYLGSEGSKHVLQSAGSGSNSLGGQLQLAFILFSDIRGFTQMTEALTSKETLRVLNQIFTGIQAAVEKNGGEINKFIGDAALIYFKRSAENEKDEAVRVIRAAFEMQKTFTTVARTNNDLKARNVKIGMGVGIVAGHAIMGNLGSRNRMEFTLIGNSVNLSSRLCSICPQDEILVNEEMALLVSDKFHIESRLPVQLKGLRDKVTPYCVLGDLENRDFIHIGSGGEEPAPAPGLSDEALRAEDSLTSGFFESMGTEKD
jgi:class 3 adenylate cyclase